MSEDKKAFYTRWWFWTIIILMLIAIPFIINYAYLKGTPDGQPNTAFSASDMILFYGSFLAFIGTITLGFVAYKQNERANDISSRILKIEENKFTPYIKLNILSDKEFLFNGHQYDMTFKIDNQTTCPFTNLLITNASEVIISDISINEISIGGKTYTSDKINENKTDSYFLDSLSSKKLILIYPDKHFLNKTSETIIFNFQLTTIYSKTYTQKIIIKHKPNDYEYEISNATCVTINNKITEEK